METEYILSEDKKETTQTKTFDDYVFQFYIGSLSIVSLFILFRLINKAGK
jgi:hypothetical protein